MGRIENRWDEKKSIQEQIMKLDGWITPRGQHLHAPSSHGECLRINCPGLVPDDALKLGYIWVLGDEDNYLELECHHSRLFFARKWVERNVEPGWNVRISVYADDGSIREVMIEA